MTYDLHGYWAVKSSKRDTNKLNLSFLRNISNQTEIIHCSESRLRDNCCQLRLQFELCDKMFFNCLLWNGAELVKWNCAHKTNFFVYFSRSRGLFAVRPPIVHYFSGYSVHFDVTDVHPQSIHNTHASLFMYFCMLHWSNPPSHVYCKWIYMWAAFQLSLHSMSKPIIDSTVLGMRYLRATCM